MNEMEINALIVSSFIFSLVILYFLEPPKENTLIEGRVKEIYFKDNNLILNIESCNYNDVIYLDYNKNLSEVYELKNQYVKMITEKKEDKLYFVKIEEENN